MTSPLPHSCLPKPRLQRLCLEPVALQQAPEWQEEQQRAQVGQQRELWPGAPTKIQA